MNRKTTHIFLRIGLFLTLLLAPPFATREARAQFIVTDLGAAAQRAKASIVEAVNFGLEIEKMAETLLTATGNLEQATKLAKQMEGVYKTISGAITKGREILNLYKAIEETWSLINEITGEYQYYANSGALSSSRIRKMNYLIRQVSQNVEDIVDYVSNTLLKDLGLSVKDKKDETDSLLKSLRGRNAALKEQFEKDKQDLVAYSISQIEQGLMGQMIGRPVKGISDGYRDLSGSSISNGGVLSGTSKGLLTKIDWDAELRNESLSDDSSSGGILDNEENRLFRVVYMIEGLITILMAPIAYWRKNKGEGNAQDALLKVVFGFFFSVILTSIVQSVFF